MKERYFSALVFLTTILFVFWLVSPFLFYNSVDLQVGDVLTWNGYGAIIPDEYPIALVYTLLLLISRISILSYNWISRWIFLFLVFIGIAISPLFGLNIVLGWDQALGDLVTTLDGILVALIFWSNLSIKFENSRNT